jgi:hypothetical protein
MSIEIANFIITLAGLIVAIIAGIYIPIYLFHKQHHLEHHPRNATRAQALQEWQAINHMDNQQTVENQDCSGK